MSLQEIFSWLAGLDFPSLSAIWTWLIIVPWWLSIGTIIFAVFAARITWNMTFYFLNWLFDWTFKAGERFGELQRVVREQLAIALEFRKSVKKKLFG